MARALERSCDGGGGGGESRLQQVSQSLRTTHSGLTSGNKTRPCL